MPVILDFEKPICELEIKILELQKMGADSNLDVEQELNNLKQRINETKKTIYQSLSPWQKVQLARHPDRPYTLDYISKIFTNFIELHGDRRYAEDPAIVGGFAKLDDDNVMIIGTQKGRNIKENVHRNFGCSHPEGYRKALRLMKLAEKANKPIISLIDTPGAFPGIASEERHIGEAIAVNLREMFGLKVPIMVVVIGEGGSGGALGIGIGDKIALLENSYYSVITPEGCAAILWKDRSYSAKAANALKLTAKDLCELGIVDEIIPEPIGGAHRDWDATAQILKNSLKKNLKDLSSIPVEKLLEKRYAKYRKIGIFSE
jgi:acetyl-CoA carboxylase carboxyl transferase subunit alpha